ncbi:MAG: hypothetical protein ROO76_22810 [Terriglobia bacterium]|nr:hypothetical protein [Terriglobia bacterium]
MKDMGPHCHPKIEDQEVLVERGESGMTHERYLGSSVQRHRSFVLPSFLLLSLIVVALQARATTYTVKAAGGGSYTTISGCAAVAVAGDTCLVYAGSYAGWTQPNSGSAGKLITFQANSGDTVNITGGVTISGRSYIRITGFHFTGGGVTGNNASTHNQIDHNTFVTTGFNISSGQGSGGSDNIISYNTVTFASSSNNSRGFNVYGDRNLLEHNEVSGGGGDCFNVGGSNVVVRNNYCHDQNGATSGEHIDFVQVIGGTAPTLQYSLIENNIEQNCINDAGNCHFLMIRASGGQVADTLIARHNFVYSLDGSFGGIGYHADGTATVPNAHVYHNTVATEAKLGSGSTGPCANFDSGYGVALNNICYNTAAGPYTPIYFGQGGLSNGNIAYTDGYSGYWNSPYSTEATYNTLKNQNPDFANYPTDASLQTGSPAIEAGVALTTVSSGCGSSSLVVTDARFFQPGWGPDNAKVQADRVRVGSSATAQITSINYSTSTLTLASSISCSAGDPVWLYSNSTGTQVLSGAAPNIGSSFGSGSSGSGSSPAPPLGLAATVN